MTAKQETFSKRKDQGENWTAVTMAPIFTTYDEDGREISDPRSHKITSLRLYKYIIRFSPPKDGVDDELYFLLFKDQKSRGEGHEFDGFGLLIGTERTGFRLVMKPQTEENNRGVEIFFTMFAYWQKINPDDPKVLIASESEPGTFHILENKFKGTEGFFAPYDLTLSLGADGSISLIPAYVTESARRQDNTLA